MTLLCASIFVNDVAGVRREAARALERGADLVELRIDRVKDTSVLGQIGIGGLGVPVIVTCRPEWEGGEFDRSETERLQLLRAASEAGAKYIDLELDAFNRSAVADAGIGSQLIVSSHDFRGRPERLYNLIAEINAHHGAIGKIVWTARTIRDNLEAFELLRARQKPMVAFCMGEAGLISRVLAKKFGSFLSFASMDSGTSTAPGQIAIDQMKNLYRWDALGPKTKVYGVVAEPVAHSMSPAIHNAAFSAMSHDGVYLPMLVHAGYESFKAFMESFLNFEGINLAGLSVTLPHKENALRYLIEKGGQVEELAGRIGAVNTIIISPDGKLRGMNTDYAAILDSITHALSIGRDALAGMRVAVIGAGGTGRTAVAALSQFGASVVVYNRTIDRAQALADEFNGRTGSVVAEPLEKAGDADCQVYINTTSVGMYPKVDQTPIPKFRPRRPEQVLVFDTVYNPIKTQLLTDAEAAGAKIVQGTEMFVRQAAGQFIAWTGKEPPMDLMRETLIDRLEAR